MKHLVGGNREILVAQRVERLVHRPDHLAVRVNEQALLERRLDRGKRLPSELQPERLAQCALRLQRRPLKRDHVRLGLLMHEPVLHLRAQSKVDHAHRQRRPLAQILHPPRQQPLVCLIARCDHATLRQRILPARHQPVPRDVAAILQFDRRLRRTLARLGQRLVQRHVWHLVV